MEVDWELFLAPYSQVVNEMKVKLRGIRKQYLKQHLSSPIEFVTGRVKPIESILKKAELRGISAERLEEEMQDIAGLRIMVQFVEDIQTVAKLLRARKDFKVKYERDYIANKKASGYRSYHMIAEYPVETLNGKKKCLVEIQLRTLAMNFWATIEHSLNYKYKGNIPEALKIRLKHSAEFAHHLDQEMSEIREEVREAQVLFEPMRKLRESYTEEEL